MDYHTTVEHYINSTPRLDAAVGELLELWRHSGPIEIGKAKKLLRYATSISPNILNPDKYIPHCFEVSARSAQFGEQIGKNYPLLENLVRPEQLAFAGLTEDVMYLVGGDGSNNPNEKPSNPVHEILTYLQLEHLGYQDLAEGMALHFASVETLSIEQEQGRFLTVPIPNTPHPMLDILTGVDALCKDYWLPSDHQGDLEVALRERIDDVIKRRGEVNHPLITALKRGGRQRIEIIVSRLNRLMKNILTEQKVKEIYSL